MKKLHKVNPNCLAVISSTINMGDMDKIRKIHKRIAYNPEFIKQGSVIKDFLSPKFVLIGAYIKEDAEQVAGVWKKFHDKPICVVKPVESEIIKLCLNVSYTLGISFANMVGELCETFGADSDKVLDVIYKDRRNYKAGLGFSGPCFPRDVNCFGAICLHNNILSGTEFANLLNKLNDYTIEKYLQRIKSTGKKKIGILGVAYKPGVPYIYESQPIKIAQHLASKGYEIYIHDRQAEENAKQVLPKNVNFCFTVKECVQRAEVLFIGTPNFKNVKTDKQVVNPW